MIKSIITPFRPVPPATCTDTTHYFYPVIKIQTTNVFWWNSKQPGATNKLTRNNKPNRNLILINDSKCSGFKGYKHFSRNDDLWSVQRTLGVDKFQRTTALYSVQCFVIHPVLNQPFVGSIEKYHLVHIIIIHARSPTNTLTHTHYYNIILLIISRSSV